MSINIIGAGLAGSMVAKELQNNSIKFKIFDSNEVYSSSKISENLFSPTWLKGSSYLDESIKFLNKNYKVQKKVFKTAKSYQEVLHIPVNNILWKDVINEKVDKISNNGVYFGGKLSKGINIICAGYYTKDFVKIKDFNALSGHGLLFEPNDNNLNIEETMRHYRPYTHEKIIKWYDGRIWYGDSTAIIHETYVKNKNQYIKNTLERAKKIGLKGKYNIFFGSRPFINNVNKKLGVYKKINDNTFVITGGWKDGLVIYPNLVMNLMKDLNCKK
jgi:hypothetical protein